MDASTDYRMVSPGQSELFGVEWAPLVQDFGLDSGQDSLVVDFGAEAIEVADFVVEAIEVEEVEVLQHRQ